MSWFNTIRGLFTTVDPPARRPTDPALFLEDPEVHEIVARLRADIPGKEVSDIVDDQGHQYVDLVMEGGGVLGVALLGYTFVLEEFGIRYLGIGGTSAGSINALMLAAAGPPDSARSRRVIPLLAAMDPFSFVDGGDQARRFITAWVAEGFGFEVLTQLRPIYHRIRDLQGINPGNAFLDWLTANLRAFGITNARQLREQMGRLPASLRHRLGVELRREQSEARFVVIASEIVTESKVHFPDMANLFWADPDAVNPALFVRASMSIPFFFEPLRVSNLPSSDEVREDWARLIGGVTPSTCLMVDGGVMSNFPIAMFHVENEVPSAPTFGVKLGVETRNRTDTPTAFASAVFNTARHSLDNSFIRTNPDYSQLVATIDTGNHNWLNFRLSDAEKLDLFLRGARAASKFIEGFDWEKYKKVREELKQAHSLAH